MSQVFRNAVIIYLFLDKKKVFAVFKKFWQVFRSFWTCLELFGRIRMRSDTYGYVRMHTDAFRCVSLISEDVYDEKVADRFWLFCLIAWKELSTKRAIYGKGPFTNILRS